MSQDMGLFVSTFLSCNAIILWYCVFEDNINGTLKAMYPQIDF